MLVQAEFIKSAFYPKDFPIIDLPEVCFVGKSNVGKSSAINTLINRKDLARVGKTPGKTRLLNFFSIKAKDISFVLVDLPGYGYAQVSKKEREEWKKSIENYLKFRNNLKLVVFILDIRRDPDEQDEVMFKWLKAYNKDFVMLLTKSDKLSNNEIAKRLKELYLHPMINVDNCIIFSSLTKRGKDELYQKIVECCTK
ncbi:ribosome biogenesis GTP-binding protein YihA/YsxC [Calditerrivibrio nitroreducens]|uniref:Probable GTP-binding protein EngB n=1 Tax=Calditerrivibrio nitroreducens (strain DSM 19672 / NBRC 101217 / Yu37-1) TaxID=768670 RepID=E4TH99_CALNY|nr:ribosome biogenesis GTP-binding protein YihA/YsxC [Calditerrivibrio nitroreducens]ADR18793.1 ribosome biogenesis GTP-binding protein YsxC [Calditerrivibrio nitroreducens DSM 19672]